MRSVLTRRFGSGAALALAGAMLLSGCGGVEAEGEKTDKDPSGELTVEDAWVVSADEGMTAVFGILDNSTDEDIVVESAECDLSPVELHEMNMKDGKAKMSQKEDGFTVASGDSYVLEAGGDHLMLMDLQEPIHAGDEIEFTLQLAAGDPVNFTAVAKDYAGADEDYEGGDDHSDHGDEGHDDHGDEGHAGHD